VKATDLLEKQHRKVESIFKRLEAGRSDPEPLLEELATNLVAHMAIEQEIFYPAIRSIDEDMVGESFEEHALAEIGLKRLLGADPKDDSFKAKVVTLKELIEHHVEEEEEELFPKVEKKLGDQLEALGKRMRTRFDEVVAQGYEEAIPRGFARTSADTAKNKRAQANGNGRGKATQKRNGAKSKSRSSQRSAHA
jgi:hemerythrin-like domain-containing protein